MPVLENTFYQWYDWLINHISESMKKSGNYTKLKVILFELKIDNDTTTDSKKKVTDAFEHRYVEYKSSNDKGSPMKGYPEKIRLQLRDIVDDLKKSG